MTDSVPEMLRKAADIYEQRNAVYGDNYKTFGSWAAPLLADVTARSPRDMNRLGILIQIMGKLGRYVANFNRGGHEDSLIDMAVYAMMLSEMDQDK